MSRHLICFLVLVLLYCAQCQNEDSFDTSLFHAINSQNGNGSWVISPASIRTVLEETFVGSGGDTQKQLGATLGISDESQIVNEQSDLNGTPNTGVVWKTANWILVKDSFPLLPSYKDKVTSLFHSQVNNSDFSDAKATADTINSWVSNHTEGLITHLISPSDIGPMTVMMLLNAVFFDGTWLYKFDKKLTTKQYFFTKPGKCNQTDMMKQTNNFLYGRYDPLDVQILKLQYNDSRYSMVLVLPTKYDGLEEVVQKLPNSQILDYVRNMTEVTRVELTMPKFTSRFHTSLNAPLQEMGLTSMFKRSSNFSAISDKIGVYVSEVIHEAYISVTESGTKAAAATGVGIRTNNVVPTVDEFNANHPFLYFLTLNNSHVLFTGQYYG